MIAGKMAVDIEDIDSLEKLIVFLKDQPIELVQIVASRNALRVFPLIQSTFEVGYEDDFSLMLTLCRASLISWAASKILSQDFADTASVNDLIGDEVDEIVDAAVCAAAVVLIKDDSLDFAVKAIDAAVESAFYRDDSHEILWNFLRKDLLFYQKAAKRISFSNLIDKQLWNDNSFVFSDYWKVLGIYLLEDDKNWQVWTDWYEHVLHGANSPKRGVAALSDEKLIELAQKPNEFWERKPEVVNAEIAGWVGTSGSRIMLATLTTPEPFMNEHGELDVQPNPVYDKPEVDDDLVELPIRQLSVIKTIKSGLSGDKGNIAPNGLFESFEEYENELLARGTQPFVGVLSDQADIIQGYMNAKFAKEEWMRDGVGVACEKFLDNHAKILKHFPLDQDRENKFENFSLVEEKKSDPIFNKSYKETIDIVRAAKEEGITSGEFLRVLEKRLEHAKIVSSLPEQDKNTSKIKKKAVLKDIGFWDKSLDRMEKIRKFSESETGRQLYSKGKELADWLSSFINFSG